ncbi:histidine phosphatase family protein [Saccharothrix sp. AJ9571]|nr:histidine phosphatase family protein [Saccharothrix sp. AJ9571]
MRIILLRHAESLGNVDELAYTRIPDHSLPLTDLGREQARRAGPAIAELVGEEPLAVYVSPYVRTRETLRLLGLAAERLVHEPRLREQDWGNLQEADEQAVQKRLRHEFGHFFYRLPFGESGADVDDRVAAFLSELESRRADPLHPRTVLVVSHGLTIRLLCRRLFGWSIELFESLSNPATCEYRVVERVDGRWKLDRPFQQWRDSPDGAVQQ